MPVFLHLYFSSWVFNRFSSIHSVFYARPLFMLTFFLLSIMNVWMILSFKFSVSCLSSLYVSEEITCIIEHRRSLKEAHRYHSPLSKKFARMSKRLADHIRRARLEWWVPERPSKMAHFKSFSRPNLVIWITKDWRLRKKITKFERGSVLCYMTMCYTPVNIFRKILTWLCKLILHL